MEVLLVDKQTYVIAEIGQAHDGSYGIAKSMIKAIANAGADAVKFQMHIADAESSENEEFRIKFSDIDKSRLDYWKRMEFSEDEWSLLKDYSESLGLDFLVTPFSVAAVERLNKINVGAFKIGSGDIQNDLMIDKILDAGKPIFFSNGLSDDTVIENLVRKLEKRNIGFTLFECTTAYPTKPEQIYLNNILRYKEKFGCKVGLSDHSGEIYASLAAVALGANAIEVHVTFDKNMYGPDSMASLNFSQLKDMIDGIKFIEKSLSVDKPKIHSNEKNSLIKLFGRSLAVNRNMEKGELVTREIMEAKKPMGYGINVNEYETILNKKFKSSLKKGQFLNYDDLE